MHPADLAALGSMRAENVEALRRLELWKAYSLRTLGEWMPRAGEQLRKGELVSLGDDGKVYRCNDLIDLCYREMSKAILGKEWVRVKAVERVR